MLGLYVHIPFCSAICNYCNFNRGLFDAELKARYVEALLAEMTEHCRLPPLRADSIYFGGGTPSLIEPEGIARATAFSRSVTRSSGGCRDCTQPIAPATPFGRRARRDSTTSAWT